MDKTLSFRKVHAFHMNDAMFELGSGRDRHDNIGRGKIGVDGFRTLLNYNNISKKVLILETPQNSSVAEGEEIEIFKSIDEN